MLMIFKTHFSTFFSTKFAQVFLQKLAYFKSISNFFEIGMYLAAILFVLPFSSVEYIKGGYIKRVRIIIIITSLPKHEL